MSATVKLVATRARVSAQLFRIAAQLRRRRRREYSRLRARSLAARVRAARVQRVPVERS